VPQESLSEQPGSSRLSLRELYTRLAQSQSISTRKVARLKEAGLSIEQIAERYAQRQSQPCPDDFLTPGCVDFPDRLRDLFDPPLRLFFQGIHPSGFPSTIVGVVGSRKASRFGNLLARRLGEILSRRKVGVCSGLAMGIDGAVHKGVLDYLCRDPEGGQPIAVLGHGWGRIHPPEHKGLAKLVMSRGTLLTEYPRSYPPSRWTFPARNRIIAALSDHVVIVEAGKRSGSLYTAEFASELGRTVWVVPNAPGRPNSEGVLSLLRCGAEIICDLEEFAEKVAPTRMGTSRLTHSQLQPVLQEVMVTLQECGGSTSMLCQRSDLSPRELACHLSELEMTGYLRRQLDGNWEILRFME
jgi:DNA processing protein